MLIPPFGWGLVERGLSRSGMPSSINLAFLAKQRIRTVVYLAPEEGEEDDRGQLDSHFLSFVAENNIDLVRLGGAGGDEADGSRDGSGGSGAGGGGGGGNKESRESKHGSAWKPTSEELVLSALSVVLDPRAYPLHVMCSSAGRHRTGVVIGCFRKLQRWSLSSICAEYRRYAGGSRGADGDEQLLFNEQFIELFDIELLAAALSQRSLAKHLRQLNIHCVATAGGGGGGGSAAAKENDNREKKLAARSHTPAMTHSASSSAAPTPRHQPAVAPSGSAAAAAAPTSVAPVAAMPVPLSSAAAAATSVASTAGGVAAMHTAAAAPDAAAATTLAPPPQPAGGTAIAAAIPAPTASSAIAAAPTAATPQHSQQGATPAVSTVAGPPSVATPQQPAGANS